MLNAEQTRNYNRCQKLSVYLTTNTTVYSSYIPFHTEAQNFAANFALFQDFTTQKHTGGTAITLGQKELKNKIALQVAGICDTATAYALQNGNPALAAATRYSKSDIMRLKDADVFAVVLGVVNALQPLMTDAPFIEYDITPQMLGDAVADVTTFRDNIGKGTVVESGGSIANQKINEVIKELDRNVKLFNKLVNKFAASHPDFVAGYHINAALESPATRHTGIAGIVTNAATGNPIADAIITIADKNKEAITGSMGDFSIVRMYGGEYEMMITAKGFATKTLMVRVQQGKTVKVQIAL